MVHNGRVTTGTRRWLPPLLGLLTFVVVLVAGGVVATDWQVRGAEMRSLIAAVEASEAAMISTQAAVGEVFGEYRGQQGLSEEQVAEIDAGLTKAAQDGLVGVTQGGVLVSSVLVLPWHADIREAQEAYLAHNRAWQAYLAAAIEDPAQFGADQPEVSRTFDEAEAPLRAAVPVPDLWDLAERIDVIYADVDESDGGDPGDSV